MKDLCVCAYKSVKSGLYLYPVLCTAFCEGLFRGQIRT